MRNNNSETTGSGLSAEAIRDFSMTHGELVAFLTSMGLKGINPQPSRMGDPLLDQPNEK